MNVRRIDRAANMKEEVSVAKTEEIFATLSSIDGEMRATSSPAAVEVDGSVSSSIGIIVVIAVDSTKFANKEAT